jgi:hypothetical protein
MECSDSDDTIEDDFPEDDHTNHVIFRARQASVQDVGSEIGPIAAATSLLQPEDETKDILEIVLKYAFRMSTFRGEQKVCTCTANTGQRPCGTVVTASRSSE